MSVGRALSVALVGLTGHVVEVEADVTAGLPAFVLVGLPDASLVESRDRVRAALRNAQLAVPDRRVVVNLSPASLPKAGAGFDLAMHQKQHSYSSLPVAPPSTSASAATARGEGWACSASARTVKSSRNGSAGSWWPSTTTTT